MAKTRRYEDVLDEDLKDPAEAAGYLNACLEDGDPEVFLLALRDVARARGGVARLAEVTELNREHLYRLLSENGNPSKPARAAADEKHGNKPSRSSIKQRASRISLSETSRMAPRLSRTSRRTYG